jgi:hypothetical protein
MLANNLQICNTQPTCCGQDSVVRFFQWEGSESTQKLILAHQSAWQFTCKIQSGNLPCKKACFSIFCGSSLSVTWPNYERLWQRITPCHFALDRAPDNRRQPFRRAGAASLDLATSVFSFRTNVLGTTYNNHPIDIDVFLFLL